MYQFLNVSQVSGEEFVSTVTSTCEVIWMDFLKILLTASDISKVKDICMYQGG
jgi:hypothetical protein